MPMDPKLAKELSDEAERIEEDALFSSKGHYNAVKPWLWTHRTLGVGAALGSGLAGIAVLRQWNPTLAILAAAVGAILAILQTALRPGEEAARHQRAADRYLAVRKRAPIFRNIELLNPNVSDDVFISEIKAMSEELSDIRSGAPLIPKNAYEKAKREIEVEKTAEYKVDKRIQT